MKAVTVVGLSIAWEKYRELFGEDPHGTEQQMAALLEFIHDDDLLTVSLEDARLVSNVFLPQNPNKLRTAHPDVKAAVVAFKAALNQKLTTRG